MNNAPHTVGEVINTVVTLCTPAKADNIVAGRAHDGLRNNLHPRALCDMWEQEITAPTLLLIQTLVSRYQGRPEMNVAQALAFLDSVHVAPAQPGVIGRLGRAIYAQVETLVMRKHEAMPDAIADECNI